MATAFAQASLGGWSSGRFSAVVHPPASGALLGARAAPLRPAAALPTTRASTEGAAEAHGFASAFSRGLCAIALGLASAASWRRASCRPGTGRVVVRGRNFEKNIKTKKGPREARDAKIAKKHLSRITIAIRDGGPNEEMNGPLARAIKAALKDNVPRATIENRIKKFVEDKEMVIELNLGGYGAGGTAVLIECVTDNTNRTRAAVAEAFKEVGGQMGQDGCVDHLFKKQGVLRFKDADEEKLVEASLEADVEDCVTGEDGILQAITEPTNLTASLEAFEKQGFEPSSYSVEYARQQEVNLNEANSYAMKHLLALLEEIDDVEEVHHTANIMDEVEVKFTPYGVPLPWEKASKQK